MWKVMEEIKHHMMQLNYDRLGNVAENGCL